MGDVNFYLKKPAKLKKITTVPDASINEKRLIYLQFRYNGKKLVFSFGKSIEKELWDDQKHRVKSTNKAKDKGYHHINDLLKNLEAECLNAYHLELKNGIPPVEKLREHLIRFINRNEDRAEDKPSLYKLIKRFIDGEIKHQGKEKSESSIQNYKQVLKHLQQFEVANRYKSIIFLTIVLMNLNA